MTLWHNKEHELQSDLGTGAENVYKAAVVGLRDFVQKSGFSRVILGLSGGVDSALVAVMAVDAIGKDNVDCVMMPSPYTSQASMKDAGALAGLLGVKYRIIPIEPMMQSYAEMLMPHMKGRIKSVVQENIQARIRGTVLMAQSNNEGSMLLATSNKSELAVGYATLYGDMCGGFAPIKDIYKTHVYEVCRWRNGLSQAIPDSILIKEPSAELQENQKDQDSLPPYDVLDAILEQMIEGQKLPGEITKDGDFDKDVVMKVWHLLNNSEYKRFQYAPGTKLSSCAFGRDWRQPLAQKFGKA